MEGQGMDKLRFVATPTDGYSWARCLVARLIG